MADGYDDEFSFTIQHLRPIQSLIAENLFQTVMAVASAMKISRPQLQMQTEMGSLVKMMRELSFNYHHSSCSVTLIPNGLQYS